MGKGRLAKFFNRIKNLTVKDLFELLNVFGSLVMITLLVTLLWYSFIYFNANYPYQLATHARMFYVAMGVTIATVIAQWIEGRWKSIKVSLYNLNRKGGVNGIGKERGKGFESSSRESVAYRREANSNSRGRRVRMYNSPRSLNRNIREN